jgi:hypothetical protein
LGEATVAITFWKSRSNSQYIKLLREQNATEKSRLMIDGNTLAIPFSSNASSSQQPVSYLP